MADQNLIKLSELPGFQTAVELYQNPRNLQYPQAGYTQEKIDKISVGLFCITESDVEEHTIPDPIDEGVPLEEDEIDDRYSACYYPWEDAKPFWEAIGWDLSDADGDEHYLAARFKFQIIATLRELVPGAKLCLDGNGVAAYSPWGGPKEEVLEGDLEADAAAFLQNRGKFLNK